MINDIIYYIVDGMLPLWTANCYSQDMAVVSNGTSVNALNCLTIVYLCSQMFNR